MTSGRTLFDEVHIARATYIDLLDELSDRSNTDFVYAMPSAGQFEHVMSAIKVGDGVGNVARYDGSLTEWTSDPDLPMETG